MRIDYVRDYLRMSLTVLWVLLLGVVFVVATVALAPAALIRLWTSPVSTKSERIRKVQKAVR